MLLRQLSSTGTGGTRMLFTGEKDDDLHREQIQTELEMLDITVQSSYNFTHA